MRQVSPELAAAIEAPERTHRLLVSVDWEGDGYGPAGSIDDLSGKMAGARLSRTLQGDVPDEVQVVEGSVVASLNLDLAAGETLDERLDAIRHWSRWNTASPMYGKPRMNRPATATVELLTSAGWQGVPRVQGLTRSMPVDVGQRIARLGILDRRQLLRSKVSLPAIIAAALDVGLGPLNQTQSPGLESTWIASHVLALNGVFVSPPPRPGCRLWMPMHGSAFPHIGDLVIGVGWADFTEVAGEDHRMLTFETGPYLLGTTPVPDGYVLGMSSTTTRNADEADRIVTAAGTQCGRIEFWARIGPADVDVPEPISILISNLNHGGEARTYLRLDSVADRFELDLLSISAVGVTGIAGPAPVRDEAWHFYGAWWDSSTGEARFAVDGVETSAAFAPFAGADWDAGTDEAYDVVVDLGAGLSIAEFHVTGGTDGTDAWLNAIDWTRGAVIDRGYPLSGNATTEPQDSWELLTALTSAGLGATWYDEDGVVQVASAARLITEAAQTVQRTVTSLTDIVDLAYDDRADTIRNRVICGYSPIILHLGEPLWSATEKYFVRARTSVTIEVELVGAFVTTPTASLIGANSQVDGGGNDYTGYVSDTAVYPTARTAIVTLTNSATVDVWLVDTDGNPSVVLVGDWVEQGSGPIPADVSDVPVGEPELPLQLSSNPWRQTSSMAAGVAMAVLCSLREEQQALTRLVIPADPRLQFYDRIRVRDQGGTEIDAPYWVTGVGEDYGPGYLGQLSARPARDRFYAGTGIVGQDLVG